MWKSGFINAETVCLIKCMETPVLSGFYLLARKSVTSRISFLVRILSLNLNLLRFWAIRSVGFLSVGFKADPVFVAILVKIHWIEMP